MKPSTGPSPPRAERSTAFTLIELLVVVAIIAVLASMLLPALQAARSSAKTAECMTRQRSFGMWIMGYRDDNEEFYPVNSVNFGGTGHMRFVDLLRPYDVILQQQVWQNGPAKNYWLCPGQGYQPTIGNSTYIYANWSYISTGWRLTNYMNNGWFGYGNLATQNKIWWPKRHTGNIPPSEHALMGEIKTSGPGWGYTKTTSMTIYPHRMSTGTNIVLVDGHVDTFTAPLSKYVNKEVKFY